jgi:hypothetical protein
MPTVIARPVEDAVSIVSGAEVGHTFVGFEFRAPATVTRGEDFSEHHSPLQLLQAVAMGSFMYISLALKSAELTVP